MTWSIRENLKYARAKYTDKHAAMGGNELKCREFSLSSTLNASRMVIPKLFISEIITVLLGRQLRPGSLCKQRSYCSGTSLCALLFVLPGGCSAGAENGLDAGTLK